MIIPDDSPGQGWYMTLNDIREMLLNDYGAESGNPEDRLPVHEVDQAIAGLKEHKALILTKAGVIFIEDGVGLYSCYLAPRGEDDE